MAYDWILDVLTDLRDFARQNGMAELADHLEGTLDIARVAVAQGPAEAGASAVSEEPDRDGN